jgi:hypothetical protein
MFKAYIHELCERLLNEEGIYPKKWHPEIEKVILLSKWSRCMAMEFIEKISSKSNSQA